MGTSHIRYDEASEEMPFSRANTDHLPKNMQAYIYHGEPKDRTLELVHLPTPFFEDTAADRDAVIVKVMRCSVCRTDVSQFHGELGEDVVGKIPGHEVRARVVAVNSNRSGLQLGDEIVYFGATDFGGLAEYKKITECVFPWTVNTTKFWTSRYFTDTVGAAVVRLAPHELKSEGSLLEPLTSTLRALYSYPPPPNGVAVILGAGPIGILALQCMKKVFGIQQVIMVDVFDDRLDQSILYGADKVYNLAKQRDRESIVHWANEQQGLGADYCFEALPPGHDNLTWAPEADARLYGTLLLKAGGTYVLFSAQYIVEKTDFWWPVLAKNIKLNAAGFDVNVFPMQKSSAILKAAKELVLSGLVEIGSLVNKTVLFTDARGVNEVFLDYGKTTALKTVIQLSE